MDDFAAVYGAYAAECLRLGIRPLAPEQVAALLQAIQAQPRLVAASSGATTLH